MSVRGFVEGPLFSMKISISIGISISIIISIIIHKGLGSTRIQEVLRGFYQAFLQTSQRPKLRTLKASTLCRAL